MTALVYSNTPVGHTSDVEFRAWAQELNDCIVSAGWAQSTDTGQLNIATAVRPGASTYAGYRVYVDPSSLQATFPCFLKIQFGTGSSATGLQITVQIGTSTNGAGTLTGTLVSPVTTAFASGVPSSTTTNYPTLLAYKDGYLMVAFKKGAMFTGVGGFIVARSMNSSHAVLAETIQLMTRGTSGAPFCHALNAAPVLSSSRGSNVCLIPGGQSLTSLVGLDVQVYKHYMSCPRTRCAPYVTTVLQTDVPDDTTISIALTDATSHTYRAISGTLGISWGVGDVTANHILAALWE